MFHRLYVYCFIIALLGWVIFVPATIFTLGLFIPVYVFCVNAVFYLFPLLLVGRNWLPTYRQELIFGLTGVVLIAILPGAWSALSLRQDMAKLKDNDFDSLPKNELRSTGKYRSVEFIYSYRSRPGKQTATRDTPCDQICQKLLLGGEVQSVIVRTKNSRWTQKQPITYRVEENKICPSISYNRDQLLPATEMLYRRGICIVPYPGEAAPADSLRVSLLTANGQRSYISEMSRRSRPSPRDGSVRRLEIAVPDSLRAHRRVFRQTEVIGRIRTIPFFMMVTGGMELRFSVEASSSLHTFNAIPDLEKILRTRFGFKFEIPKDRMPTLTGHAEGKD